MEQEQVTSRHTYPCELTSASPPQQGTHGRCGLHVLGGDLPTNSRRTEQPGVEAALGDAQLISGSGFSSPPSPNARTRQLRELAPSQLENGSLSGPRLCASSPEPQPLPNTPCTFTLEPMLCPLPGVPHLQSGTHLLCRTWLGFQPLSCCPNSGVGLAAHCCALAPLSMCSPRCLAACSPPREPAAWGQSPAPCAVSGT